MPTLGLSQIVKNEAHVIERMLKTLAPILDYVAVVDTGSTDGTQDIIRKFCKVHNIECEVIDRPFDNFENSRNAAMQLLGQKTDYGIWLDADEQIVIDPKFNKKGLDKDLYMITTYIGPMKYTRNELWRTKKPFRWYGPCHEFIVCDDQNITSGIIDGLTVQVQMDGGSWKGDVSEKYRKHSQLFEDFIQKDKNSRWLFYTAQSFHDSACVPDNKIENDERLRRSMYYYKERVSRSDGYEEERYYSQLRIGTIMMTLEEPWSKIKQELTKAYTMDPLRAEAIKVIIDHYHRVGEWHMAYMYSKFAKTTFHGNNPYPRRILFVDEQLYNWKFLESHAASCFYTGRKEEAQLTYQELVKVMSHNPALFGDGDKQKITANAQFLM